MLSSKALGVKTPRLVLIVNGHWPSEHSLLEYGQGVLYVQLSEVFRALAGNTVWAGNDSPAVVTWQNNLLVVPVNEKSAVLNGEKIMLGRETLVHDGKLYVCIESLAEAFSGSVRQIDHTLHLHLPLGRVLGLNFTQGSLVLSWSGNLRTTALPAGQGLCLEGTGWPATLRAVVMERTPEGHIVVKIDVRGGSVASVRGEQGVKFEWKASPHRLSGRRIALDAGHGGQQPGAIGPAGCLEKELTRQIVDRLAGLLRELQVEVLDIRPEDQSLSLAERVNRARQGGAEAFLSVHFNAHERSEVSGTETYHFAENTAGRDLARLIHTELIGGLKLRDRGVKQAAFYVLRTQPDIPAAVVEIGFLTNPTEELFLARETTQQKTAHALCRALTRYFE
ncbi:MAG: N-acetylmuramoyl-L-alanine amidase LytC [Firmicutes bacterium]|nr:N-acetylmuramoyl-L-alanine amidase LytC [candidate division NPL-UPA2 bacterium]